MRYINPRLTLTLTSKARPCTEYDERLAASAAPSAPDGYGHTVTDQV